ncbi:MAG TPA: CofH family radical SAM protein [Fimbriimonadales bacterium]|nr:CofH family radical SAM protein [Fimbriimonadales bacterium]
MNPGAILGKELLPIYEKVDEGERLSFDDGMKLYETPNLAGVGFLANIVRERKHGAKTYYVRNQHINYTNICNKFCKFCSFYAKKGGPDPYEMSIQEVRQAIRRHKDLAITEIHSVGGINPRLPYSYYLDFLRAIREERPGIHIKAFTAVEIVEIARVGKTTIEGALRDLMEAGLDSLPGGGIEILSDRVHEELFGKKLNGEEWKEVARVAAKLGLRQYATMLYGHIETDAERVDHLIQLRELQDQTGHFLCMTPLSFHPENTELADIPHPTGDDDLRNIAVSRLMLDNFDHVKSFWIMNTPAVTQLALWYGADDADGTVLEYEITYEDGAWGKKDQSLDPAGMVAMIREAGRVPIERDSLYNEVVRDEEPTPRRKRIPLPMSSS